MKRAWFPDCLLPRVQDQNKKTNLLALPLLISWSLFNAVGNEDRLVFVTMILNTCDNQAVVETSWTIMQGAENEDQDKLPP